MDRQITRHYHTGNVTIVWQPHKCTHSGVCFRGLPQVFDPRRRPWVDVTAADTAAIVAQVEQCPSAALSWIRRESAAAVAETVPASAPATAAAAAASTVLVDVLPDGPLVVHGSLVVRGADGVESTREMRTAFCRCGQSAHKPFCDGSHRAAGFRG